jgi:dienelactone hydrolase
MALYKPEGDGPFPALVLQHQCGGLKNRRWTNEALLDWARVAVARGWVVLQVDSLGPRGVDTVCMGPKGGVTFSRGTRDALQAAAQLATLPYVDKTRIATAGYSWGAMNALLGSSKAWGEALADGGPRFRASVALYPGCFTLRPPVGAPYEVMNNDTDRPLLVLMGGQDTETPASDCLPKLEAAKAAGAPVRWHLYPQATHCWDCKNLDGMSKVDVRGNQVSYRYDAAATQDSQRRVFEFLEEVMDIKR